VYENITDLMFCCTREGSLFLLRLQRSFLNFKYVHIVTMILIAGKKERKQRQNSHAQLSYYAITRAYLHVQYLQEHGVHIKCIPFYCEIILRLKGTGI
jgi:hypothetical protein